MEFIFFYADPDKRRYPVWIDHETVYTDPNWDLAGGNVPYIRSYAYPIPKELIQDGKISRKDLLAFLDSIKEPVPAEAVPEWIELKPEPECPKEESKGVRHGRGLKGLLERCFE